MKKSMSDRMSEIRRRMAQEDVSVQERKAMMKEKFSMMSEPMEQEVEYRAIGGPAGGPAPVGEQQVAAAVTQAQQAGASDEEISSILKANAMKSRDARVRGALLKGGLLTMGKASANQAGLITQAGLNNRSFTPESAMGGIAQGATEAASAEAKYQGELSAIEQAAADAQAKSDKKTKGDAGATKKIFAQANEAIKYLNGGWKALVYSQKLEESYIFSFNNPEGLLQAGAATQLPGDIIKGDRELRLRKELRDGVKDGKLTEQHLSDFQNLLAVVNKLGIAVLDELGPGPKTDFDFEVAMRTIANLDGTPNSIGVQLVRLSDNAMAWMDQNNVEYDKSLVVALNVGSDEESEEVKGTVNIDEETAEEFTQVGITPEVTSEVTPEVEVKNYTKDNPLKIPNRLTGFWGAAALASTWLRTHTDLKDTDYISYDGDIMTYGRFKEL